MLVEVHHTTVGIIQMWGLLFMNKIFEIYPIKRKGLRKKKSGKQARLKEL